MSVDLITSVSSGESGRLVPASMVGTLNISTTLPNVLKIIQCSKNGVNLAGGQTNCHLNYFCIYRIQSLWFISQIFQNILNAGFKNLAVGQKLTT